MTDPVNAIARQIRRRCGSLAIAEIRDRRSKPWSSLLFDGARHRIGFSLSGHHVAEAIDAIEADIADDDFVIAGHIVAELQLVAVDRGDDSALLTIEALTIETP